MANVAEPIKFPAVHDAKDRAEYLASFSRVLLDAENIQTILAVDPYPAALAGGLLIDDLQLPAISSDQKGVVIWCSIDPPLQEAAAFDGAGVVFLIEVTVLTDQQRRFQRTFALQVRQL